MTDKMKLGLLFSAVVVTLLIQMVFGGSAEAVEIIVVDRRAEQSQTMNDHDLRLRVIAHSDDSFDQVVKRVAVFAIEEFLNGYDGDDMRGHVQGNLEEIRGAIAQVLVEIEVEMEIEVSFGYHYFPASSNYYESLVVRLGDGAGENWWCFINPGICTVPNHERDSVNEAQVEVTERTQYRFGDHTRQLVAGLFGRTSGETTTVSSVSDEFDWFLFDDER